MRRPGHIGRAFTMEGTMPQQSLFGGWAVTDLEVSVHLEPGIAGGRISVVVKDENGTRSEAHSVKWVKPRDVTDLGHVLKAVGEAFLWGEPHAVSETLSSACRGFLPNVPSGQ
jgi:hypothetical protein